MVTLALPAEACEALAAHHRGPDECSACHSSLYGPKRRNLPLRPKVGLTAARLLRAFATQVEAHRRSRNGGQQFVRVEHVHVNDGGQAVIGNVKQPDGTVSKQ